MVDSMWRVGNAETPVYKWRELKIMHAKDYSELQRSAIFIFAPKAGGKAPQKRAGAPVFCHQD